MTKLADTLFEEVIRFGDLDLIFKVTPALELSKFDQKSLSAPYLLNQMRILAKLHEL